MKKTFKAKAVCEDCGGTGLYQGMAERDGAAIVCNTCKGTGCEDICISYEPFVKRKLKRGIKRVFKSSCGYMHGAEDVTTKEGVKITFSAGGCTYEDWLKGADPKPVKELYCPYLWTGQHLQSKDVGDLYKNRCNNTLCGGLITGCKYYKDKIECWKIYEEAGGK